MNLWNKPIPNDLKDSIIQRAINAVQYHMTINSVNTYTDAIQDMLYVMGYWAGVLDFIMELTDMMRDEISYRASIARYERITNQES